MKDEGRLIAGYVGYLYDESVRDGGNICYL